MSRPLTPEMLAQVSAASLAPLLFLELDFSGGFLRLFSGVGTIQWNGLSWVGAGNLLAISQAEDATTLVATSMSFMLSGIPSALLATIYGDQSQGRAARLWLACQDLASGQIIADPVLIFAGRMDTIGDDDDGATAQITLTAESNLADLGRPRTRNYTNQDQLRLFPGDKSLRWVTNLQERPVYWGTNVGAAKSTEGPGPGEV